MALVGLLFTLLNLYTWVIIIRALVSWVSPAHVDPRNPIVRLLVQVTEPVLAPLRQVIPPQALGGIDVSPIVAILLIQGVKILLAGLI